MVGCRTFRTWRVDGRMLDIPEVEIWRTVLLWMFLLSLFSPSLYFFTSLDLGPVQMASARVFTTSGDKSSGGGVSLCAGSAEWLPNGTDRFWDLWVRTFAYVEQLFGCFLSTIVRVYAPQGSAPKEGDNVTARLHVTCPGPGNTSFRYSRLAMSLRSLAIILPLYYSTVLTSTCATVSTDIPSYEAIHGRMPLHQWSLCIDEYVLICTWTTIYITSMALLDSIIKLLYLCNFNSRTSCMCSFHFVIALYSFI